MILGIVLISIAVVAFYLIHTTSLEDDAVQETYYGADEELTNRFYLHLGIAIFLIVGIVSIIKDLT